MNREIEGPDPTDGSHEEPGSDPTGPPPEAGGERGPEEVATDLLRQFRAGSRRDRRTLADRRASERRRRHLWSLVVFFCTVLAVLLVVPPLLDRGELGARLDGPPEELAGTWTTADPRYADRFMTITPESVVLGLGPEGGRSTHSIESIYMEVAEVHRQYRITYESEDGDQLLEVFVYDDGVLRLSNPSAVVWQRR